MSTIVKPFIATNLTFLDISHQNYYNRLLAEQSQLIKQLDSPQLTIQDRNILLGRFSVNGQNLHNIALCSTDYKRNFTPFIYADNVDYMVSTEGYTHVEPIGNVVPMGANNEIFQTTNRYLVERPNNNQIGNYYGQPVYDGYTHPVNARNNSVILGNEAPIYNGQQYYNANPAFRYGQQQYNAIPTNYIPPNVSNGGNYFTGSVVLPNNGILPTLAYKLQTDSVEEYKLLDAVNHPMPGNVLYVRLMKDLINTMQEKYPDIPFTALTGAFYKLYRSQ